MAIPDTASVGAIGRIPVRNIWLLMLYASELYHELPQARSVDVEDDPDELPNLVAELLTRAVERRMRRNLSFGYRRRRADADRVEAASTEDSSCRTTAPPRQPGVRFPGVDRSIDAPTTGSQERWTCFAGSRSATEVARPSLRKTSVASMDAFSAFTSVRQNDRGSEWRTPHSRLGQTRLCRPCSAVLRSPAPSF